MSKKSTCLSVSCPISAAHPLSIFYFFINLFFVFIKKICKPYFHYVAVVELQDAHV